MNRQPSLGRILLGYALLYVAVEGAGRLPDGLGLAAGTSATAAVGVVAAVLVELVLHGQRDPKTLLVALGFGAPDPRVLGISIAVSAALLTSMPAIVGAAGGQFVLPDDWPALALGILLLNGLAEETVYRGYLFRRLRHRYAFRRAVALGTALAALAHLPIVVSAGWLVGLVAILVAVLFERGGNTIWAPAAVHSAADCIIPLGALGLVSPPRDRLLDGCPGGRLLPGAGAGATGPSRAAAHPGRRMAESQDRHGRDHLATPGERHAESRQRVVQPRRATGDSCTSWLTSRLGPC